MTVETSLVCMLPTEDLPRLYEMVLEGTNTLEAELKEERQRIQQLEAELRQSKEELRKVKEDLHDTRALLGTIVVSDAKLRALFPTCPSESDHREPPPSSKHEKKADSAQEPPEPDSRTECHLKRPQPDSAQTIAPSKPPKASKTDPLGSKPSWLRPCPPSPNFMKKTPMKHRLSDTSQQTLSPDASQNTPQVASKEPPVDVRLGVHTVHNNNPTTPKEKSPTESLDARRVSFADPKPISPPPSPSRRSTSTRAPLHRAQAANARRNRRRQLVSPY